MSTARAAAAPGIWETWRGLSPAGRFVLLGVYVNQFGAFLQLFLVLYLTHRGFSGEQAGIALAAYSAGAIGGTIFGGTLCDRLGSRATIVISMGSAAVFTLGVTLIGNLAAIVVIVAVAGAMTQSSRPAVTALLTRLVPASQQLMMLAMFRTALNAGQITGPLVATWLATVSWNAVFWVDATTSLAYCLIALFLLQSDRIRPGPAAGAAAAQAATAGPQAPPAPAALQAPGSPAAPLAPGSPAAPHAPGSPAAPHAPGSPAAPQVPAAPAEVVSVAPGRARPSYRAVLRDRRYLAYLALMLANGIVHIQGYVVLPLMLKAEGYPTLAYSAILTISAAYTVAGGVPATKITQRWPVPVAVLCGWGLLVLGRGGFGLPGGYAVLLIASVAGTTGTIIGGPGAFAWPAKVAPKEALGRYMGAAWASFGLGYAIGPVAGVFLWNHLGRGFWPVLLAFGAVMTVPGIWGMRQRPAAPPRPAPAAPAAAEPAA